VKVLALNVILVVILVRSLAISESRNLDTEIVIKCRKVMGPVLLLLYRIVKEITDG